MIKWKHKNAVREYKNDVKGKKPQAEGSVSSRLFRVRTYVQCVQVATPLAILITLQITLVTHVHILRDIGSLFALI